VFAFRLDILFELILLSSISNSFFTVLVSVSEEILGRAKSFPPLRELPLPEGEPQQPGILCVGHWTFFPPLIV